MCASAAPEAIAAACAEDECAASCTTGLAASLGSTVHGGGYCVQLRDGYGDYTAEHHAMIARADKYLAVFDALPRARGGGDVVVPGGAAR